MSNYNNYFKEQYKISFSEKDLMLNEKWFSAQWNKIKKEVEFVKDPTILEIGSAYGGLFNFIKNDFSNFSYVGLELDQKTLKFASDFFAVDSFYNLKIENYKTKKRFDYIFAFEVLEHLDDPISSINKIKKLLKNSGKFIGTSPYPYAKNVWADKTHTYVLHPENWKKLFEEAGFAKVDTFPMSFMPFFWRINKHLNIRIPVYIPFKYFISTTLLIAQK